MLYLCISKTHILHYGRVSSALGRDPVTEPDVKFPSPCLVLFLLCETYTACCDFAYYRPFIQVLTQQRNVCTETSRKEDLARKKKTKEKERREKVRANIPYLSCLISLRYANGHHIHYHPRQ